MNEQNKDISNFRDDNNKQKIINLLEQAKADLTKLRDEVRLLKAKQEVDEFFET
jgi:hypothetical protein